MNTQNEVWVQLLVTLEGLCCDGNGIYVGRLSRIIGVSVGTVCVYTEKVIAAILDIKEEFIKWPNKTKRKIISKGFFDKYGVPSVVVVVDNTFLNLFQRPHIQCDAYFTRTHRYVIDLLLICNHMKQITYMSCDWPESVHN